MRVFTPKEGLWEEGGAALVCRGQGVLVEICEQKSLCKAPPCGRLVMESWSVADPTPALSWAIFHSLTQPRIGPLSFSDHYLSTTK